MAFVSFRNKQFIYVGNFSYKEKSCLFFCRVQLFFYKVMKRK